MTPPSAGTAPPASPVPEPRGTIGTPAARVARTTSRTSAVLPGITTTSGLLSNSLLHLDRFPDQRELIRRDPTRIPAAIEELLRYDAPIQALARTATRAPPNNEVSP